MVMNRLEYINTSNTIFNKYVLFRLVYSDNWRNNLVLYFFEYLKMTAAGQTINDR